MDRKSNEFQIQVQNCRTRMTKAVFQIVSSSCREHWSIESTALERQDHLLGLQSKLDFRTDAVIARVCTKFSDLERTESCALRFRSFSFRPGGAALIFGGTPARSEHTLHTSLHTLHTAALLVAHAAHRCTSLCSRYTSRHSGTPTSRHSGTPI